MPYIDQIVLGLMLLRLIAAGFDHWRWGQRGWRFVALTLVSLYGIALVVMLSAHCADIIYNVVRANRSVVDGSPFTYNWRTYSLLLFGAVIIERGVRSLAATRRLTAGDATARADILRSAGIVLLITAPTIPIHAFFGTIMAGSSALVVIVAAVALRSREGVSSLVPSPASAARSCGSGLARRY